MLSVNNKIYSVTEVNNLVKEVITNDHRFALILISGEIVNYKKHTSGHLYFSLKDEDSRVKCVMFKLQSRYLSFRPMDGMKVLVQGRLSVYAKNGEYQLYADSMHQIGVGNLHFKFLELKERLQKEGLFDQNLKRMIPKIPRKIGVVTSATGAALYDIVKTAKTKYPPAAIVLAPASVQGTNSASEIVTAIKLLNTLNDIDVIIVGRGGGATEELWSFNEEIVIRAIRDSKIPVVSAVGHEIDTTLADLAADKVAATPTAAGALVVPDITDLYRDIDNLSDKLNSIITYKITFLRSKIDLLSERLNGCAPFYLIRQKKEYLNLLDKSLKNNMLLLLDKYKLKFEYLNKQLIQLNPLKELAKGYALVYNDSTNIPVSSVNDISVQADICIEMHDGYIRAKVTSKEGKKSD